MTAAKYELKHLIDKVSDIQKRLGGPTDKDPKIAKEDEFDSVKLKIAESINFVSKKQDERDNTFAKNGRSIGVIKMNMEIQDGFTELDLQLAQMKDVLRRQRKSPKKFPAAQVEIKEQQYQKYENLVQHLKNREEGGDLNISTEKGITLTELRLNITNGGTTRKSKKLDVSRELDDIETEALQRFKENDKQMDNMLDDVNAGLDNLKNKAMMMGDQVERQKDDIGALEVEIIKAQSDLNNANTRLKKILFEYRKPSKFCMDVCLILLLLGLIAVIIKLSTG